MIRLALRIIRVPVSYVASAIVIGILLLGCLGCQAPLPSTDAGADPEVSNCCLWWVVPLLYDKPHVCLCRHTQDGEQRWLSCLDGLEHYTCDKRGLE